MSLRDSFRKLFPARKVEDRASLSKKAQETPQDPQIRQKLGLYLLRQGEIVEGIDQLARSAVLYEKSGFTGKAVAVLRHMLKYDASNLDLQKWLIRLLSQQGHMRDAQDQLTEIATKKGYFASDDQKIEFFRQVGESTPQNPLPALFATDVLIAHRKFFEAVNELRKIAPHIVPSGLVPEFTQRMNTLVARAGDNPEMLEPCGFLWLCAGRAHEALPLLKRASTLEGTDEEASRRAGEIEQVFAALEGGRESDLAGTLSFSEAAKRLAEPKPAPPTPPEASPPAPAAPQTEEDAEETRMVQDAVSRLKLKVQEEIGESDPEARYNLGIAYKEMGLLTEAAEEFRLARTRPSLFLGASCLLADTLSSMDRVEEALEVLNEVISSDSVNEASVLDVRYQKALLVTRAGREEEAREIFLSIYEIAPDFRDVRKRTEPFRR